MFFRKHPARRRIAVFFIAMQLFQLLYPVRSFALMSGPSQPEVQSFEPVSTTQTVDQFTGDFNYNIPLLDVDGYPINISYHSGYGMEDEASWVGEGWNINPGCINRSVRGLPDDFNGEKIQKKVHIRKECNIGLSGGVTFDPELFGYQSSDGTVKLQVSATVGYNFNNYKGLSASLHADASFTTPYFSSNLDMGINSQDGANVDASVGFSASNLLLGQQNGEEWTNTGTGFNTRSGLKNITYGISYKQSFYIKGAAAKSTVSGEYSSYIPIGLQNYVAVVTNPTTVDAASLQVKIGGENYGIFNALTLAGNFSLITVDPNATRSGYGYLYAANATSSDILDFSREKDGQYNNTMSFLPTATLDYDIYSVSGQGTGGMFRPFRNDIATVYDPVTEAAPTIDNSGSLEFGGPQASTFEVGVDFKHTQTDIKSGPWLLMPFTGKVQGSLFEDTYFKAGGELTKGNVNYNNDLFTSTDAEYLFDNYSIFRKDGSSAGYHSQFFNGAAVNIPSESVRATRASHLQILTIAQARIPEVAFNTQRVSVSGNDNATNYDGAHNGTVAPAAENRTGGDDQIGTIIQTQPDGRRYVYGLPARNNITREAVFSVARNNADIKRGTVYYTEPNATDDNNADASRHNKKGRDHYYSNTLTPGYAHSFLLTGVLSDDYVDLTGDGISDDDLGTYTKLSYNKWSADYRWKSPYVSRDTENLAQYNPGLLSDDGDDKGQFLVGSKELWHVSAIEGKNQIAIFYTSRRDDAMGATEAIKDVDDYTALQTIFIPANSPITDPNLRKQFKLDSIALFNKNDYIKNGPTSAVPIKTVIFDYAYQICPNTPNSVAQPSAAPAAGSKMWQNFAGAKLTLKQIYTRYGHSHKSLLSPYIFDYKLNDASGNPFQYVYEAKNRWGGYKPPAGTISNWEFPYIDQDDAKNDDYAAAWQLVKITLPSGGIMNIDYESDDYSYVQDKSAMQMLHIGGVGRSKAFEPGTALYGEDGFNTGNPQYQYIYFKRQKDKENTSLSLQDNYSLGNLDYLYFSMSVDIGNNQRFENVKGYAKIDQATNPVPPIGYCNDDPNANYGYIRVQLETSGPHSSLKMHPAVLMGLNMGRYYLPQSLYPGLMNYKPDGTQDAPGPFDVLKGLLASGDELLHIASNPNGRFMKKSKARFINIDLSFIRTGIPGRSKKGGGSRVKRITLSDSWDAMANPGTQPATYGQEFIYTIDDPVWGTISSGVASYEPMIGGDENPLRLPVPYTADAGRLMPAIKFYQELPLAENLYPPPVVGYSRVATKSIHYNGGQSTQNVNITEYYTAKDFPVITDYTDVKSTKKENSTGLTSRHEELNVVQGYSIRLNDMHGKMKSTANYVYKTSNADAVTQTHPFGDGDRELITSTTYQYNTDAAGRLNNSVPCVVWKGHSGQNYAVEPCSIGEEEDITVDSRSHSQVSDAVIVRPNLNVISIAQFIIPIPTIFDPGRHEEHTFKDLVTTKVIQQYGILASVTTIDHGAQTTVQNTIYDSETGAPVLTRTNNEFNDDNYNLSFPAYRATGNENMGPAYQNTDFSENPVQMYVDESSFDGYLFVNDAGKYNVGDELLVELQNPFDKVNFNPPNGSKTIRLWVAGVVTKPMITGYHLHFVCGHVAHPPDDPQVSSQWKIYPDYDNGNVHTALIVVPRSKYVIGTTQGMPWIDCEGPINTASLNSDDGNGSDCPVPAILQSTLTAIKAYQNFKITVIRSGKHNQLNAPLAQVAFHANKGAAPDVSTYEKLLSGTDIYNNVLAATAYTYSDNLTNTGTLTTPVATPPANNPYVFNDFVMGQKGIFRNSQQLDALKDRSYVTQVSANTTVTHARAAGMFTLMPFLTYASNSTTGSFIVNTNPVDGWHILKSQLAYSPYGHLLEEMDNNGVHSAAQLGFNHSLVTAVGYNTNASSMLYEGFEDVDVAKNDAASQVLGLSAFSALSPFTGIFAPAITSANITITNAQYSLYNCNTGTGSASLSHDAHTGNNSLYISQAYNCALPASFVPSSVYPNYLISIWAKNANPGKLVSSTGSYQLIPIGNPIDGWSKYEATVPYAAVAQPALPSAAAPVLQLNATATIDDIRIMPQTANMKCFAFDALTQRLMATLDENHYATFYEYDQSGALIRTKKETERGIITLQENRSSVQKQ